MKNNKNFLKEKKLFLLKNLLKCKFLKIKQKRLNFKSFKDPKKNQLKNNHLRTQEK